MSVTAAQGFRAAGIAAGIKKSGKADLALVVNDGPRAEAAGVFTRNKVKAAPVLWSQQVLTTGSLRAVVLNSGGANACTGAERDSRATSRSRNARIRIPLPVCARWLHHASPCRNAAEWRGTDKVNAAPRGTAVAPPPPAARVAAA